MPNGDDNAKTTSVPSISAATDAMTAGMSDVQRGLAWFITAAFVILIFVWVFKPPTMAPESMAQLNQMVSTLQNILLIAIGFFFGSSKSSQNKDEAQARIVERAAGVAPPVVPPVKTTTTVDDNKTETVTEPAAPANKP